MEASKFKQTFLPLTKGLYWTAWRLTGNREEAEDLVQDVMLRLWTVRDQLADIANAEAYCRTLMHRRFVDTRRMLHPTTSLGADTDLLPSGSDLLREAELNSDAELMHRLIAQLPEQQRVALTLRDVEDRDYDEIAQRMGLTEVNVRALVSRGRKAIRENFDKLTRT